MYTRTGLKASNWAPKKRQSKKRRSEFDGGEDPEPQAEASNQTSSTESIEQSELELNRTESRREPELDTPESSANRSNANGSGANDSNADQSNASDLEGESQAVLSEIETLTVNTQLAGANSSEQSIANSNQQSNPTERTESHSETDPNRTMASLVPSSNLELHLPDDLRSWRNRIESWDEIVGDLNTDKKLMKFYL